MRGPDVEKDNFNNQACKYHSCGVDDQDDLVYYSARKSDDPHGMKAKDAGTLVVAVVTLLEAVAKAGDAATLLALVAAALRGGHLNHNSTDGINGAKYRRWCIYRCSHLSAVSEPFAATPRGNALVGICHNTMTGPPT